MLTTIALIALAQTSSVEFAKILDLDGDGIIHPMEAADAIEMLYEEQGEGLPIDEVEDLMEENKLYLREEANYYIEEFDVDGDGISGRVNWVWDPVAKKRALGRFGWKANVVSLYQQVAGAAVADMGITTSVYPTQNCLPAQSACLSAPEGGAPELDDARLAKLVLYSRSLAVPARRNVNEPIVRKGELLFLDSGCGGCHLPNWETSSEALMPELAGQNIHAYTDLLLHDMGEGLADGRPDFEASGREWRTPPLWGIGLIHRVNFHEFFLHDGRARGLMEAILWHGGEAEFSRDIVRAMPSEDREALLAFLNSL